MQAAGQAGKRRRREGASVVLSALYAQATRAAAATAFLDVLTLQRDGFVTMSQDASFGEISVSLV